VARLLDRIDSPSDLKGLIQQELKQLADEVRQELVATVTATGWHLASNLGAVELTIALHRVFDSPRDKIVWDVGHQIMFINCLPAGGDSLLHCVNTEAYPASPAEARVSMTPLALVTPAPQSQQPSVWLSLVTFPAVTIMWWLLSATEL